MRGAANQRLATWVLIWCTPDNKRDALIGDLLEQYQERGALWYWRQALGAVRAQMSWVLMTATETQEPAADYIGDLMAGALLAVWGALQLGLSADLVLRATPLITSVPNLTVAIFMIGAALMGAVAAARRLRNRQARAT